MSSASESRTPRSSRSSSGRARSALRGTDFTESQLIELGHFTALTLGQQRVLKTVRIKHGE